jgi:hypothetical protein
MAESVQYQGQSSCNGGAADDTLQFDADFLHLGLRELHTELKPGDLTFKFCTEQGARVQRNGLSLPNKLSFRDWRQIGSQVLLITNSSPWWVGDWLAYGENFFEDRYEQVLADTSLDYQTLRNYAWVAKKFTMSRRRDSLSFGHHAEVAACSEAEQDIWLNRAEKFNWSRNELRRRIRATRLANQPRALNEGEKKTKILKIDVATERLDLWLRAAERMNCSVAEWIINTLDGAAAPQSQNDKDAPAAGL